MEKTIPCTIPSMENVTVTYNMLMSEAQADTLHKKLGREGSAEGAILRVEGWDADTYGPDPWDVARSPILFRLWACRRGWAKAMNEWVADPNS